jgi:hypothetical protein
MTKSNMLELLLYSPMVEQTKNQPIEHEYERGMFISINNHKLISADLYQGFKKQYQSIMYGLTGSNISRDTIKVSYGRLPKRQVIMDLVAKKKVLLVAGIHDYKPTDQGGRGSRWNYEYQHSHFYIYGAHHYLPKDPAELQDKIDHLERLLQRGSNIKGASYKVNTIKPVGRGKYLYSDPVTPTTLYEYLTSPPPSPAEVNCINYIKYNANNPNNQYPPTYLYQEF